MEAGDDTVAGMRKNNAMGRRCGIAGLALWSTTLVACAGNESTLSTGSVSRTVASQPVNPQPNDTQSLAVDDPSTEQYSGLVPSTRVLEESSPVLPAPDTAGGLEAAPAVPGTGTIGSQLDVASLLGLDEAAALFAIEAARRPSRIVARDGEEFMVTMDFVPHRVNLRIDGGVVVDVEEG